MKRKLLISLTILLYCSCSKGPSINKDDVPADYKEMFAALNLQPGVTYQYTEVINNLPTGNKGTVMFSLVDNSIVETYYSQVTKDHFKLDDLKAYSCNFESLGRNKYNITRSVFINNARRTLSYVNGTAMVSFDSIANGSYYFYQYLLSK